MGRILAIDYGTKRTGLAVSDPLKIIATALDTIDTGKLISFLSAYFKKEPVEEVVMGLPKKLNNEETEMTGLVKKFAGEFSKNFPGIKVCFIDERYTSKIAQHAMVSGGMRKSQRQQKGNVDKVSATLILQGHLESRHRLS